MCNKKLSIGNDNPYIKVQTKEVTKEVKLNIARETAKKMLKDKLIKED